MAAHSAQEYKYLKLLSREFPTQQSAFTEIINLQAILNLPKATEHFISDIHGEYEAFTHILNNCSGVIRDRVADVLGDVLNDEEMDELCTLIYYPKRKLSRIHEENLDTPDWYRTNLMNLVRLARYLSNFYTRSKVRRAMPVEFAYIIDELLHEAGSKSPERHVYHVRIVDSIIETGATRDFIISLANLIKRLAVDHLHVVGDLWDRGPHGDRVVEQLIKHHSLDIQWGNHDVCWMGAAAGSEACIASVVRTNVHNNTLEILESSYGISLRELALFGEKTYTQEGPLSPLEMAITVIMFKLEGQLVKRRPEFELENRIFLHKLNLESGTVEIDGVSYPLTTTNFPTIGASDPYALSDEEAAIVSGLSASFADSPRLRSHINFLYEMGSMYKIYNDNLIFHGCIPLNTDGTFRAVRCGDEMLSGKRYLDFTDELARRAWYEGDQEALDWMWYLSCGKNSTVSGRVMKTFERAFVADESTWDEPEDPYWEIAQSPRVCDAIFQEFGIAPSQGHIVNGHTPVNTKAGESPIRADGKFLIIDGGFCEKYHDRTGIAGYTLVYDDSGMRIKAHLPFESAEAVLTQNADIGYESETEITHSERRLLIVDTDIGTLIRDQIVDLQELLHAYRTGELAEHST